MELSARERIVLALDTSDGFTSEKYARIAKKVGARFVKIGLELQSITSWQYCSDLAGHKGLEWIADAKIDDIPNTTARTVHNIASRTSPPFGITVHTRAGRASLEAAQEYARNSIIFGVTELTSVPNTETRHRYHTSRTRLVNRLAREAAQVVGGVVVSAHDIAGVKANNATSELISLVPGIRSEGSSLDDQVHTATPFEAIRQGADLIVMGREIMLADDPYDAFEAAVEEVERGLASRG